MFKEDNIWIDYDIVGMVNSIIKHPFVSYYRFCSENNWDNFGKLYPLFYFLKYRSMGIRRRFKETLAEKFDYCFTWLKLFIVKIIDKRIIEFKIKDGNDENFKSYPRYDLEILVNNEMTDEEIDQWEKFWFKKYRNNISGFIRYYVNNFDGGEVNE
jgi:hypothetical protein